MRGRVYDATTRTFLTPDPIVGSLKIGGWNKYAYVFNNPLKYIDPTGFDGEVISETPADRTPPGVGELVEFSDDPLHANLSVAPTTQTFDAGDSGEAGLNSSSVSNNEWIV
ncbi:MAG TPA: RHS repeat-associated core domain-containing protein, partial [Polyangiaceae bacterium]